MTNSCIPDLFDADHYRRQTGLDLDDTAAWQHFLTQGDALGLDPCPYFSTRFYKQRHRNWNRRVGTAFEDFLFRVGRGHDRQPHPLIDPVHYRASWPDLNALGAEAVLHFIRHGDGEGRSPSAGFDADFYRRCYLPLGEGHPFHHHVTTGAAQGCQPRPEVRDGAASRQAMEGAAADLPGAPILLVAHDAQLAGVPFLTLDLGQALKDSGRAPVFILENAGPLLQRFRALGPSFVLAEGWGIEGLAEGLPTATPALINTAAAAPLALPLARAGLDCRLLVHEMPAYLQEQNLMPALREAALAGVGLIASMPRMATALTEALITDQAEDFAPVAQILPGTRLPQTALARFRQARNWRRAAQGPVFIGAGHADRRKGFDLFLSAARRIAARQPDARFIWLGARDAWADDLAREALADNLALSLPGFVSDSPAWYRAADVYLLTSRQDPGPTTAIHAAAVGTPFVGYAADIGLIGVAEGAGRFVPAGDENALVALACEMATRNDATTRRRLRRVLREATRFDRYVAKLLDDFRPAEDQEA